MDETIIRLLLTFELFFVLARNCDALILRCPWNEKNTILGLLKSRDGPHAKAQPRSNDFPRSSTCTRMLVTFDVSIATNGCKIVNYSVQYHNYFRLGRFVSTCFYFYFYFWFWVGGRGTDLSSLFKIIKKSTL